MRKLKKYILIVLNFSVVHLFCKCHHLYVFFLKLPRQLHFYLILIFYIVEELQDDSTLLLLQKKNQALTAATEEHITFEPHYNTLIQAGTYEYYASEGQKSLRKCLYNHSRLLEMDRDIKLHIITHNFLLFVIFVQHSHWLS